MAFPNSIVQPLIFPPRFTSIYWDAGVGVDNMANSEGKMAKLEPYQVTSFANDVPVDITYIFGGATYFPYACSRPLVMTTDDATDWSNFSFYALYKNVFGLWIQSTSVAGPAAAAAEPVVFTIPTVTPELASTNVLLPQYLYKVYCVRTGAGAPASTLKFDWGLGGSTPNIVLQDSQRYWGTSIEVLGATKNDDGDDIVMDYNAFIHNFPMIITDNTNMLTKDALMPFFYNTPNNPIVENAALTQPQQMMFLAGIPLWDDYQTTNQLVTPANSTTGAQLIGANLVVDVKDDNTSDLMINIVQNAVSF